MRTPTTGWTVKRMLQFKIHSAARRPQCQATLQLCTMSLWALRLHTTMTWSRRAATGSAGNFQNNIWCCLINKTFKQLNAERAARRARPKRMRLSKIIKELNKENAPPDGWRPEDKVPSAQAGGPSHKESGFKRPSLTGSKL